MDVLTALPILSAVNSAAAAISDMLLQDRRAAQNETVSRDLRVLPDDDASVILFMDEWLAKIRTLGAPIYVCIGCCKSVHDCKSWCSTDAARPHQCLEFASVVQYVSHPTCTVGHV